MCKRNQSERTCLFSDSMAIDSHMNSDSTLVNVSFTICSSIYFLIDENLTLIFDQKQPLLGCDGINAFHN